MQKILHTARLTLRPCEETDVELLHRHWTEPDVRRYLWDGRIIDQETVREVVEACLTSAHMHGYGLWLLLSKLTGAFYGMCALRDDGNPQWPDLLYSISTQHFGAGLATEGARCVLQHGFAELELPGVVASVDKPNVASIRVLEKLGMSLTEEKLVHGNPLLYYAVSQERFHALHRTAS